MGAAPVPISVSSRHFALRYEVPKFLPRGGHLCMAMLTIAAAMDELTIDHGSELQQLSADSSLAS